jgi:5-methylcytosine-specific restriction endonuclease McrBC regulatory subunit McrC
MVMTVNSVSFASENLTLRPIRSTIQSVKGTTREPLKKSKLNELFSSLLIVLFLFLPFVSFFTAFAERRRSKHRERDHFFNCLSTSK